MPAVDISLGHADLQSRETDICVGLKSSAQFAASEEDDIAALRRRLTAARLTERSAEMPWIRRGDNFKFVMSLHLDAVLSLCEQETTVEALTGHLQKAKVDVTLMHPPFIN